jgi:hypothetical protein
MLAHNIYYAYICGYVQIRVGAGIATTVAVRVGAWQYGWRLPVWDVNSK